MAELGSKTMVAKLRMGKIEREDLASEASNAVIADTPMMVTLDQIRPYELNPRVTRNPRYDEIKASIRERGLDAPPAITRRPGEQHFIIRNGGNTRLAILGELWSETKDERFYRISCLFRPWSDRGEIIALTGHLAENELHGGLSFIERALGVEKARELYEGESGQELSQSELARRLSADGYPITQSYISRMQDAVQYLLPAIPTVLYGGLGRHQAERLTALHKAGVRIWDARSATSRLPVDFQSVFQDVLITFDGDVDGFSVQRVQDELVGQMAELLKADYDALTLEMTGTESKRRPSGSSPSVPHSPPIQPTMPTSAQVPGSASPPRVRQPAPVEPELELEPSLSSRASNPAGGGSSPPSENQSRRTKNQTTTTHHSAQAGSGVGAPTQGTLEAPKTSTPQKDYSQVGQHAADTVAWSIEPGLGTPDDLRAQIAQFAREIADDVGQGSRIEAANTGMGFTCSLPHKGDEHALPLLPRVVLASLHAVERYGASSTAVPVAEVLPLAEGLEALLRGLKDATCTSSTRLSDQSLIRLFRLIRLARRLLDLEISQKSSTNASVS